MSGQSIRTAAALLGIALLVILGGAIFIFLAQDDLQGPTPAPSPTDGALASPSPDPSPSLTESPGPTPTASAAPSPTPTPAPRPSPTFEITPSPSPIPTDSPTLASSGPERELRLIGLGLDRPGLPETRERLLTFSANGPGLIRATLADVSAGRVRVCIGSGTPLTIVQPLCQNMREGGTLEQVVESAGESTWTVTLLGASDQSSPSVALRLRFPSLAPRVVLERFRFLGTEFESYNGFSAELDVARPGVLSIHGSVDDGLAGEYPYRLNVLGLGTAYDATDEGTAGQIESTTELAAGPYRVTLQNTEEFTEQEVLLRATISWP